MAPSDNDDSAVQPENHTERLPGLTQKKDRRTEQVLSPRLSSASRPPPVVAHGSSRKRDRFAENENGTGFSSRGLRYEPCDPANILPRPRSPTVGRKTSRFATVFHTDPTRSSQATRSRFLELVLGRVPFGSRLLASSQTFVARYHPPLRFGHCGVPSPSSPPRHRHRRFALHSLSLHGRIRERIRLRRLCSANRSPLINPRRERLRSIASTGTL